MASWVLHLVVSALIIEWGNGFPTRDITNTTLMARSQKANVKFPIEKIFISEWPSPSHSNMSRASATELPFVFPGDLPKKQKFVPVVNKRSPNCAKGSTFCENIDDYPQEYFANVLADKIEEFQAILGVDEVRGSAISHRIGDPDENPLCASVEQVVYPKSAKNKDDKWLYVVNQDPYMQGVRIEKCTNTNDAGTCQFTEVFPLGYKTLCKQKYIYRKLVALGENGKPVTDTFQLPSCCSCTVKADSARPRFGNMRYPTTPASTRPPNEELTSSAKDTERMPLL